MISFFSVMVVSTFLLSSYFFAAITPTVRLCRYSASSEVKSAA
jgi:hypothetical protein